MSRFLHGLFQITLVFWLTATPAFAQSNRLPFPTTGTVSAGAQTRNPSARLLLGGYLERQFTEMMGQCMRGQGWDLKLHRLDSHGRPIVRNGDPSTSFVPEDLVSFFGLTSSTTITNADDRHPQYIFNYGHQDLSALFATVIVSDGTLQNIPTTLPPGSGAFASLDGSALLTGLQAPSPQFNGARYNLSCANAMAVAASVEGEFKVPTAAISAALRGSVQSERQDTLVVAAGVFYSPYAAMWDGQNTVYNTQTRRESVQDWDLGSQAAARIFSGMMFWNWRVQNEANVPTGKQLYLIRSMSGVATRRDHSATQTIAGSAEGEANLQIPGLTANLEGRYSQRQSSESNWVQYTIAPFGETGTWYPAHRVLALPTAAQIQAMYLRYPLQPVSGADRTRALSDTSEVLIHQRIGGLATAACDGQWRLATATLAGASVIGAVQLVESHAVEAPDKTRWCEFTFSYTPAALTNLGSLQFGIDYVAEIPRGTQSAQTLRLNSTPVTLTRYRADEPSLSSAAAQYPFDPDNRLNRDFVANRPITLQWEYLFEIPHNPNMIDDTMSFTDARIECTGKIAPILPAIQPIVVDSNRGAAQVISLRLRTNVLGSAAIGAASDPLTVCKYTGLWRYQIQEGQSRRTVIAQTRSQVDLIYPLPLVDTPH